MDDEWNKPPPPPEVGDNPTQSDLDDDEDDFSPVTENQQDDMDADMKKAPAFTLEDKDMLAYLERVNVNGLSIELTEVRTIY